MATQKIIFLIIVGLLALGVIFGIYRATHTVKQVEAPKELTIWIVGDESDGMTPIIEGFKEKYPTYKNTNIKVESFGSYTEYQNTLLSVLADGNGPDIFTIDAGRDILLESKAEPIPESAFSIDDIYTRFDPVFFSSLIREVTDTDGKKSSTILGVPLGYEAMGIFYNKSLITNIPKTWTDLELLYTNNTTQWVLPAAVGLSPRYIEWGVDLVNTFLVQDDKRSYEAVDMASLRRYFEFGKEVSQSIQMGSVGWVENANGGTTTKNDDQISPQKIRDMLDAERQLTTTDLFVRGKIAMIFGYPTLIREIEKAKKRAEWDTKLSLLLTAPMLRTEAGKPLKNLAQYRYFAISKSSSHAQASLDFLTYLSSEEAEAKYLDSYPYYIAAQTSFQEGQKDTALSTSFARAKLGNFRDTDQQASIFEYGISRLYTEGFSSILDSSTLPQDVPDRLRRLASQIKCTIDQTVYQVNIWVNCSEKDR